MKSILAQLQSDEAVLLMYLAGELPPQDRAQVQNRLDRDEALRAQLEDLQAAMGSVDQHLADAGRVDDLSVARAIRQTTAALRARAAEQRQEQPAAPAQAQQWRLPGWAYPVAAAAILLLAVSIYLANMQPPKEIAAQRGFPSPTPEHIAMSLVDRPEPDTLSVTDKAEDLAATFDDSEWVMAEALDGDGLVGAMAELGEIRRLSRETAGAGVGAGTGVGAME